MAARAKSKARRQAVKSRRFHSDSDLEDDLRTGSSAPIDPLPRSLEAGIGTEVRRLRKSLDITVAELGFAAGISTGMLSKIENGAISPSLATLDALAKALNVPISRLFAETEEQRDCSFVKAGTGVRIERRGTKAGHLYDLLGHSLAGEIAVEPYLITLKANADPYAHFRHAGVEFLYMLSGRVRYRHADRSYVM
jgi:transcriptional regulator with XRE-family HTH domain